LVILIKYFEAEEQIEILTRELEVTKTAVRQNEEFTIRLNEELEHVKIYSKKSFLF
jgi:hypothetical protein